MPKDSAQDIDEAVRRGRARFRRRELWAVVFWLLLGLALGLLGRLLYPVYIAT